MNESEPEKQTLDSQTSFVEVEGTANQILRDTKYRREPH